MAKNRSLKVSHIGPGWNRSSDTIWRTWLNRYRDNDKKESDGMSVSKALKDDSPRPAFVSGGRAVYTERVKKNRKSHPSQEPS